MEAYKFETIVQQEGVIQIPEISGLANREVEVFIMVKPKAKLRPESFERFLDKWGGFLRDSDPEILKEQYLREKYG